MGSTTVAHAYATVLQMHCVCNSTYLYLKIKSMWIGSQPHICIVYVVVLLMGLSWYYKAFPCRVVLRPPLLTGGIRSICIPCESHLNCVQGLGINSASRKTTIGLSTLFVRTWNWQKHFNPPLYIFTIRKWLYIWYRRDYAFLVVLLSKVNARPGV